MESPQHTLSALFEQLGLPSSAPQIEAFLSAHRPLAAHIALSDAPCWNASQAGFLREQIIQDADWAEAVDQLNLLLRR